MTPTMRVPARSRVRYTELGTDILGWRGGGGVFIRYTELGSYTVGGFPVSYTVSSRAGGQLYCRVSSRAGG